MASTTRNVLLSTLLMVLIASAHAQPTIRLPVLRTPTAELILVPRPTTGRKLLQAQPTTTVPVLVPTTLLRSVVGAPTAERPVPAAQLAGALAALEAVRAEGK